MACIEEVLGILWYTLPYCFHPAEYTPPSDRFPNVV
jgi:hypothetical protein